MSGSSDEAAASVEALLDFCEEVEEHDEPPAVDKNRLEHSVVKDAADEGD